MDDVFIAVISHKHGVNFYAAETEDLLDGEIATFCRDYWSDVADIAELDEPPKDDKEVIGIYFECHPDETLEKGSTEITRKKRT